MFSDQTISLEKLALHMNKAKNQKNVLQVNQTKPKQKAVPVICGTTTFISSEIETQLCFVYSFRLSFCLVIRSRGREKKITQERKKLIRGMEEPRPSRFNIGSTKNPNDTKKQK